jgi:hypothetical protein
VKKIIFSSLASFCFFPFLYADAMASDCTQISNDKNRLACYDSIFMEKPKDSEVERVIQIEKPPPKILKKDSAPQVKAREEFGLPKKLIEDSKKISLKARITSVKQLSNKKVNIQLDNGQTWRTVETLNRGELSKLKGSNDIEINEALISGFVLKVEGKKLSIRVRRIK